MPVKRKEFPFRNKLSDNYINSPLIMTFQTYWNPSANNDYNTDRASMCVFVAARAPGSFQSYPDKPVWENVGLLTPHDCQDRGKKGKQGRKCCSDSRSLFSFVRIVERVLTLHTCSCSSCQSNNMTTHKAHFSWWWWNWSAREAIAVHAAQLSSDPYLLQISHRCCYRPCIIYCFLFTAHEQDVG